jgi:perosamine synthetase
MLKKKAWQSHMHSCHRSAMKNYTYGKQSVSWRDIWHVIKSLRSDHLTQGPTIKKFEDALCAYTGAQYAVAVSSGTAALHLATLVLDLKSSDIGITTPITFIASANCMLYAGAKITFADIEKTTANINPEELSKHITPDSKVLIPVHFAGQSCDMEAIAALAKKHNLYVIEDAAHAIGSSYRDTKVGSCTYSDMTIFSFHPVKTITSGEGGAITTNSEELYKKLLILRTIGITKDPAMMLKHDGPWYYEMHHLGFNYRMTDMQAALGLSQLQKLDNFVDKRRELVDLYKMLLADDKRFSYLEEKDYSQAAFHLFPLLIKHDHISMNKKQVFEALRARGLIVQVHYIPVHLQPFYKNFGFKEGDYPVAENYYQQAISLPLYPSLTFSDVHYIVETIKDTVR